MAKSVTTIIDYEGPNEVLVWQAKVSECNGDTEVIVPFSHECIFVKDGAMLDTMLPGKTVVNEQQKVGLVQKLFGMKAPAAFKCQAFYVNKTVTQVVQWGTPSQMKIIDPFFQIPVSVGASGTFDISVNNSRKFVTKIVGSTKGITTDEVSEFFSSKMVANVKDILANAMVTSGINFYDLPTKLVGISQVIRDSIAKMFDDYGIVVTDFTISNVVIPDSEIRVFEDIMKRKRVLEMQDSSLADERARMERSEKAIIDASLKIAEMESKKSGNPSVVVVNSGDSAKFCGSCGAKQAVAAKFCNKCGEKI